MLPRIPVPWLWFTGILGITLLSFFTRSNRVVAGPVLVLVISFGIALLISAQSVHLNYERRWAFLNNVQSNLGWYSFIFASVLAASNYLGPVLNAVLVIVVSLVLLVVLRRGQKEIDRAYPVEELSQNYSKLIYYNPADSRVFVESADGQTTVVNMARPGAWGLVALTIAPAAFIVWLVLTFGQQ